MNSLKMRHYSIMLGLSPVKISRKFISLLIGSIGMVFTITGNFILASLIRDYCFATGTILMLISAILEKETFFIYLQLVVLSGIAMSFTDVSEWLKAGVPIAATGTILSILFSQGKLKDRLTVLGAVGITILALGYAEENPLIYFSGGLVLAIYATMSYLRGVTIALLWAILNYGFAIAALINIYRTYT